MLYCMGSLYIETQIYICCPGKYFDLPPLYIKKPRNKGKELRKAQKTEHNDYGRLWFRGESYGRAWSRIMIRRKGNSTLKNLGRNSALILLPYCPCSPARDWCCRVYGHVSLRPRYKGKQCQITFTICRSISGLLSWYKIVVLNLNDDDCVRFRRFFQFRWFWRF